MRKLKGFLAAPLFMGIPAGFVLAAAGVAYLIYKKRGMMTGGGTTVNVPTAPAPFAPVSPESPDDVFWYRTPEQEAELQRYISQQAEYDAAQAVANMDTPGIENVPTPTVFQGYGNYSRYFPRFSYY